MRPVLIERFQARRRGADMSPWIIPEAMVKAAVYLAQRNAHGLTGAIVADEELV